MKLLILALIVVLNTGCASLCLSSAEAKYNDVSKEFINLDESKVVNGFKLDSFKHKDVEGTLYCFDDCLKKEQRPLYVFIPEDTSGHGVEVFEDSNFNVEQGEAVLGSINLVPYFVAEENKDLKPNEVIQINLSQLFICHGGVSTYVTVIIDGAQYFGSLDIEQRARSEFVSFLFQAGYFVTVPIDIVMTPPLLIVAGIASLHKLF